MKRCNFLILLSVLVWIGTGRAMAQGEKGNASSDLCGIWQMCFYVSSTPDIPGELKPSNSFKILSNDGRFTNMTVIPNRGAIIIGAGTYKCTSSNAFTEYAEKNLHLPQLTGGSNEMIYELKDDDIMFVKFFVKNDEDGNEINSWYYETWKKVKMPAAYPKDLVR